MWDVFWVFLVTFAVFGMISALYCLWGWLFRPKGQEPLMLFHSPADPGGLMTAYERVRWMRAWGVDARLYIIEDTLDGEMRKAAGLLAGEGEGLALCKTEDLCAYVAGTDGGQDPFGGLQ